MKVTLNWLKQYVDFNWSPEELTERLTMLGLEVEGVQKISAAFEGIVVAQVITRDKHPNADKLSVCRVNDGNGERQIVCGAQNFKAGDKVPLILPGASLPLKPGDKEPFTIKVGKIRGVESHGMMCSHEELGLDPEAIGHKKEDGLLILREDAKVGQPFAEYLGRSGSDVVYDLEVTPNRPDLNSVIGIAREIAALTGNPLRVPEVMVGQRCSAAPSAQAAQQRVPTSELVSVRIEDSEICPRYTARVVKGVKIGPSPAWLRDTLEKVGIRSISNVVDVTNYVMLEIGQPFHAEDVEVVADHRPPLHILAHLGGDLAQHLGHAVGVLAIGDGDVHHGEGEVARHVGHGGHGAEGDDVQAAVLRAQLDRTDRQLLDHARQAAHLDHVAHRQRILEQQEDAGDDVAHQRLGPEADGDTDDTGTGKQRGDVHAQLRERNHRHHDQEKDEQRLAQQRKERANPRAVL